MNKTDIPDNVLIQLPVYEDGAWVAPGAQVIGAVHLKKDSSVWYQCVLRGDINRIVVGERSNIQDACVMHLENDRPCIVDNDVTVGHRAILHGCHIASGALIGMGAIVLNGVVVKKGAVVGAGAVITENTIVGENELWVGVPAKCVKVLDNSYENNVKWAAKYVQLKNIHQS